MLPLLLLQRHVHRLSSLCVYFHAKFLISISLLVGGTARFTSESKTFWYDGKRDNGNVEHAKCSTQFILNANPIRTELQITSHYYLWRCSCDLLRYSYLMTRFSKVHYLSFELPFPIAL
jgi:hypothetical protein